MSNSGQAPRCQFCNSEMRLGISKTDRTRGRRFWKCTRSYVSANLFLEHFIVLDLYGMMNQLDSIKEAERMKQ
ncbi:unnamed protein product [Prunus brigantina]